jgi:capsular polysaccharide transport system ATP-binding protein
MIKIRNLTKSYRVRGGRHYVFQNVSAEFPAGANIGIIGPNGGGKSTFLSILGGIDFPDKGEIITNSTFSWPLGLKGGFVGHLSGRENCRMVCNLYGLGRNDTAQKLERMKSLSGIGEYFEEPVKYYSSGMGSRLGFALSMSFDFDYFLIDEITSVGDAHFKALARQAFQEKARKSKMIMVSHNMGDIKKFCDIAVLVKNGRLEVFEDMDAAIRAYLPQTQESVEDTAEIMMEASLDEIDIASVQLPPDHEGIISEIVSRLDEIERKLATPEHQITRADDEFYFQLAFAYQSLGNEPRALHFYRKAAESNAYHLEAQQRLASLAAARGLLTEEQQSLAAAEVIDPLNLITLDAKVRHLIRLGDLDKALDVTLSALRVDPHHVGFWSQRAGIFLALGETAKAVDAQIKAVKHAPDRTQSYQRLAVILASAGDIKSSALARHKARIAAENAHHRLKTPPYGTIIKSLRKLDDDIRL